MILYELITLDLKPRTIPLVESALALAHEVLGRPIELVGSFHTEFGPLNQVVQIRRYDDIQHFDRAQPRLDRYDDISEYVLAMTSELMAPTSISPELKAGKLGPFFELRTYTFPFSDFERMIAAWRRAMPMRDALGSPVAAIWTSRIGCLNSLTHLWPYASLEERETIRQKVREGGMWPPYKLDEAKGGSGYQILSQHNKVMLPAAFSPLQ